MISMASSLDVDYAFIVSYWLFARMVGPYLNNTHGIGSMASDKKPSKLVAQAMPRRWYTTHEETR